MTLTVVVGSSGSGKTTFLNDTTKSHKCTYIRQYHNLRPYIAVHKIPMFDATRLPFWDTYVAEDTANSIKVGGTMAGKFTAGLSGGQRKLLLFELICQRTAKDSNLLLVFDEPSAGVTDDFVPYIASRLNKLREHHTILLVTNDHVAMLKAMSDNTIVVSATDRSTVRVNAMTGVDREKAILALSVGEDYVHKGTSSDLKFFMDVEVVNNGAIVGVAIFTVIAFCIYLATYWDSSTETAPLTIIATRIIGFFCLQPYLIVLGDWRNTVQEEAEALLHSSVGISKALKSMLTLSLIVAVSLIEWGVINAVLDGFEHGKFWWAILMDSASATFPFIAFGLYTSLSFQAVQIFSSFISLAMMFYSTTYSPGAGLPVAKALRYLFPRYYFWCMIPLVENQMEGCPASNVNLVYMTLSASIGLFLFSVYQIANTAKSASRTKRSVSKRNRLKDAAFRDLQIELYGADRAND